MNGFFPELTDDIAERYIRRIRPQRSNTIRLICLPHAGGSATAYSAFARHFDPAIDVVAVQYPGRQDRRHEQFIATIDELAAVVAAAIASTTTGPYAIFGHSMGAVVGFEAARRLEASDNGPIRLFSSGRRAPSTTRNSPPVHLRGDHGLITEIRRLSGTDQRLLDDPDMVRMILPPLRNDYRAIETYRFAGGASLSCPISMLTGSADPQCTADEAAAWSAHTSAEFDMRTFSGGHFYLDSHHAAVAGYVGTTLLNQLSAVSIR